jgi:hypothetical protein
MKQFIAFIIVISFCAAYSIISFAQNDADQLVRTPSGLPIKLIVVKNNAFYESGDKKIPLDPFTILFQYKPESGVNGQYIFGTSDGNKVIGKINKDFVEQWKTRFGLFPVYKNDKPLLKIDGKDIENIGLNAEGIKQYALILENLSVASKEDEEKAPLKVCCFKGNVAIQTQKGKFEGNTQVNRDKAAKDMTFDFVYVIDTTASMEPLIEMAKSIANATVAELNKLAIETKQKIRFGIVEYRDSTNPALGFVSRCSCKLTNGFNDFTKVLEKLKCAEEGSIDIPEEVFAGLKTAIDEAGWEDNSKKHIILLGDAPAKGIGEKTQGTTGLSMQQVQDLLHQKNTGREALKGLKDWRIFTVTHQYNHNPDSDEQETARQFKLLADKADRYFNVVANDDATRQTAINGLNKVLRVAMDDANKLGQDGIFATDLSDDTSDMVTRSNDNQKIQIGKTTIRDADDVRTAEKRMFLQRYQLKQLLAALQHFTRAVKKNHANPVAIVEALKNAVGSTAAGNNITADDDIEKIIASDFPLQLNLLKVTADDIAKMLPETFEQWHNALKKLVNDIEKLDRQESRWSFLLYPDAYKNAAAEDQFNGQYRFIHNSEIETPTPIKN